MRGSTMRAISKQGARLNRERLEIMRLLAESMEPEDELMFRLAPDAFDILYCRRDPEPDEAQVPVGSDYHYARLGVAHYLGRRALVTKGITKHMHLYDLLGCCDVPRSRLLGPARVARLLSPLALRPVKKLPADRGKFTDHHKRTKIYP